MAAAQHDRTQDKLAGLVPAARETIRLVGQARADAHAAVPGNDFEGDVEYRICDWVALEIRHFDACDEEDGED